MSNLAAKFEDTNLDEEHPQSSSWIEKVSQAFLKNKVNRQLSMATEVHPCIINNQRVLVYQRGLAMTHPDAYKQLKHYAETNGFGIKEDRRSKIGKKVNFERRMAKSLPLLFLASGIFMSSAASADITNPAKTSVKQLSDVEVSGEYNRNDRAYSSKDGKRFITNPYGKTESILAVAAKIKANGKLKRVSTRGIKMPQNYVGGFINRYQHTFANGEKFSYYEGEGFGALGYHTEDKKVILDVLVGGGPFSAPQLWGPYDQILGDKDNSSMLLMMGDGKKDGMGLLKSSYAIGYTAVMAEEDYTLMGNAYSGAVNSAVREIVASGETPNTNIASR
ncbi:MAG: hypothetical protein AAF410_03930 [Pseudomonadota bacterium]